MSKSYDTSTEIEDALDSIDLEELALILKAHYSPGELLELIRMLHEQLP